MRPRIVLRPVVQTTGTAHVQATTALVALGTLATAVGGKSAATTTLTLGILVSVVVVVAAMTVIVEVAGLEVDSSQARLQGGRPTTYSLLCETLHHRDQHICVESAIVLLRQA